MNTEEKQAVQQALEALTFIRKQLKSWDQGDSVIDALRTALARHPATAIACGIPGMVKTTCPYCGQGFAFEHEQPAAPQPAHATQAEVTDAAIDAATRHIYDAGRPTSKEYRVGIARAILSLRHV